VNAVFCARLLVLALLLAATGCSDPNRLEGSLGEVMDLEFEEVEVARYPDSFSVAYWRPHEDMRDVAFKLVVRVPPTQIVPNTPLELGPAPDGTPRALVTRAVADDPIRTLAEVRHGTLTLNGQPTLDMPLSGSFRVTFGEGGDGGKGRTAFGEFEVERVVPGS